MECKEKVKSVRSWSGQQTDGDWSVKSCKKVVLLDTSQINQSIKEEVNGMSHIW